MLQLDEPCGIALWSSFSCSPDFPCLSQDFKGDMRIPTSRFSKATQNVTRAVAAVAEKALLLQPFLAVQAESTVVSEFDSECGTMYADTVITCPADVGNAP